MINEALGSAWMYYQHFNPNLPGNDDMPTAEEILHLNESQELDEATTGSAWMFYNQYNPELLKAMNEILIGASVEDVVDSLIEGAHPSLIQPGKFYKWNELVAMNKKKMQLRPVNAAAKAAWKASQAAK